MRPRLHRFTIDPSKPEEALKELQGHQDMVYQTLLRSRMVVPSSELATEPVEGDLVLHDGKLMLAISGSYGVEYTVIWPMDLTSLGLPQWFLLRLKQREQELSDAGIPVDDWPGIGGL